MQKLVIYIEKDQDIFLATIPSLNTHSTGKTFFDAMINIMANVHNLYEQLNQDNNFSNQWLQIKQKLNSFIEINKEGIK